MQTTTRTAVAAVLLAAALAAATGAPRAAERSVPPEQRGSISAERMGTHDATNIRTRFWNFGMVGDYPTDPINVDLSIFHSAEVPKGSGMNYTDGITPFVLERFHPASDTTTWRYVMETGYRERQAFDQLGRMMRFEPRPGFFHSAPDLPRSQPSRSRPPTSSKGRASGPTSTPASGATSSPCAPPRSRGARGSPACPALPPSTNQDPSDSHSCASLSPLLTSSWKATAFHSALPLAIASVAGRAPGP